MNSVAIKSNAASVEFSGVTKVYGQSVTAVDNVSLRVEAGELVTLLGPSGCGKTTTLRMIAGLEMATDGTITIGEKDVTRVAATDRDVTMVFQSYALFPHMSVMDNVSYGLKLSKIKKQEVIERAQTGLELVGLSGYGDRLPSELSGGQQQRVAVARALVLEPQVLLFDEPLSNLDAKLRRQVREDIRDIQTKLGLTVVYVTHDQEEALAVSDRIIVMKNAVIAQMGSPQELYDQPANEFVADFIGEANILEVNISSVVAGKAKIHLGPMILNIPTDGHSIGKAKLAIRPNRIRVMPPGANNTFPGIITKNTYIGSHRELMIDTEFGQLFVISDVDQQFAEQASVAIGFQAHGPVLLPAG